MMQKLSLAQRGAWLLVIAATLLVWVSELRPRRWETCADPDRLMDTRELPMTKSSNERRAKTKSDFLFAWRQGELEKPVGDLDYQIMRSDLAMSHQLTWHLKLQRLYQPTKTWVEERDVDGEEIPIHWSSQPIELGADSYIARLDYMGDRPTRSVLGSLLWSAPSQLIFGTLPVTTYIVEVAVSPHEADRARELASQWLEAVARRNREACGA